MDFVTAAALDRLGVLAVLGAVALAVITGKLVWHTQLKKAESRADRWEAVALEALSAGAQAGVRAAEVTVDVVKAIPDPVLRREEARLAAVQREEARAAKQVAEDIVRRVQASKQDVGE